MTRDFHKQLELEKMEKHLCEVVVIFSRFKMAKMS
jgi:hypothetical protein